MFTWCTSLKWLEKNNICASTWFLSAQGSPTQKFELDFCDSLCRTHTVWARSKPYEPQNFLKTIFSVSLKKDFIFQFHLYFSASFGFYFLDSYTRSQTSVMISFNIKTLNFGDFIDFVHKIWHCYSYLKESAKHDNLRRASK